MFMSCNLEYIDERTKTLLNLIKRSSSLRDINRFLDLGCGNGRLTSRVKSVLNADEALGVDVVTDALKHAQGIMTTKAASHDIVLEYMGSVTDDEKYKLYSECKVFVHPALYEPFGITLLEAQAFGKPCIITGDGGQTYVAPPGITSLYTDPNPLAMGQAISRLLNDDILYKKLSTEAKKWASRHIWSYILPKYDSIYGLL